MALLTGDGVWDGIGTLCIGILLILIALVLAAETKSLLLGESAGVEDVQKIEAAVVDGHTVTGIIHMRTLHLGPEELLVAAKIAVQHDDTATEVATAINAAEARIREAVPIARVIYLEPDIYSESEATKGPDREATPEARPSTPPSTDSLRRYGGRGPPRHPTGPAAAPARPAARATAPPAPPAAAVVRRTRRSPDRSRPGRAGPRR